MGEWSHLWDTIVGVLSQWMRIKTSKGVAQLAQNRMTGISPKKFTDVPRNTRTLTSFAFVTQWIWKLSVRCFSCALYWTNRSVGDRRVGVMYGVEESSTTFHTPRGHTSTRNPAAELHREVGSRWSAFALKMFCWSSAWEKVFRRLRRYRSFDTIQLNLLLINC